MSRLTDAFHTRCPYCQTLFRVRPEQLAIAEGRVRCGQCFSVFAAEEHLAVSAPPRGESSANLPRGVLNELGEEHGDAGSETAAPLTARRVTASVSTRRNDIASAPPAEDRPFLPISAILPPDAVDQALSAADDELDDSLAAPFAADDEPMPEASPGRPELPDDFDPDDTDYAIDDALLDDSVLGPLPARREPDWLDEPDMEHLLHVPEALPEADEGNEEPDFSPESDAGEPAWTAEPDELDAEAEAEEQAAGEQPAAEDQPEHGAVRDFQDEELDEELAEALERQPESPLRLFAWGLGCLALLALLAGQVFWAYRDKLTQSPTWRPYAEQACALLRCTLPPLRDVASIQLGASALKPNPAQAGAFDVHLMLMNRAAFAQPYPTIELSFTSLEGKRLASRRFRPEEYLAPGMVGKPMPSGTPVHVRFAILAPDASASGFEFRFYE